jgi:hypothetical protein
LDEHLGVVGQFFSSALVQDFVFGPFRGLFDFTGTPTEIGVRQTITTVALMNAAMAAIPGSIGPGLVVAIALESYMAFRIARLLGFNVRSPGELMRSVGAGAVTAFGTGVVFSEIFGTMWRTLAFLPGPGTVTTLLRRVRHDDTPGNPLLGDVRSAPTLWGALGRQREPQRSLHGARASSH